MTSSSASTSKIGAALLGLTLCWGAAGCAPRPPAAAPPQQGYADLNVLVRQNPGWRGVGQYDAALARLAAAARGLPVPAQPDAKIATLPALPPFPAGRAPEALAGTRRRLGAVQAGLMESLQDRREVARADQIRGQQALWLREARQMFPAPARTAEISSDLTLQLLQANVDALTRTLDHWDQSKPVAPGAPTPRLDTLRAAVENDRRRLQTLIASRIKTRAAARAARLELIRRLRADRLAYVQARQGALAARLEVQDARVSSAQQGRLTAQRRALLAALAQPQAVTVPAAGAVGAVTLPQGPGGARAALSAASLLAARTRLLAQRRRWVQYLYDETRAAALDAAAQRNWAVTFGPPAPGARDMTADLARAVARA